MSDTIDVVINVEDISSQLNAARSQLMSFKKELSDMPDMSGTFAEGIDRTIGAIELLQKKASEYDSSSSEPRRQTLASDQLSGLQDVNVSTQLFSQSGSFSVSLAKQMFGGLSAAAQAELNKSTAEIAAMIRSSLGSLRSKSVTGMARDLLLSPDAQQIYQSRMSHVTERQYEQYIEAQLPHVAPMHQLGEYQVARHGRHSQATITPSLQTVMPDSYLASYKAKAYQGPQLSHDQQNQYMQQDQRALLRNEIMQNDAAARAARAVPGLMQRSRDNHPMLAKNITRQQFEAYRRNLWNDYVARASGRESSRIDIFDPGLPDEERRRAYARMNGASAGQVLKAMRATEGLVADDAWGATEVRGKFERLPREARRSQEQYEVAKYTFDGIAAKANPSRVMISESPNTRLLGMSGRHNQFSDMVAVVSLSGYDKSDATHRAQLEYLLSGSPVSLPGSNKQYIAQNMHGTGEDAVLRMVEAEAYRTVMQQEHQWLKDNGLISQDGSTGMSGTNYWNNFIRENMDFGSIQGLRRHYDATGKGWTPGHDIEANLQNRKFAMVDFSRISGDKRQRFADGLAWLGKDILPQGSIQGRFAVAGKGTLHQLNHKTLGDWARSVGLISAEERFILPGIHGDVDLTDMHGMFDVSQIKNLPAYEHFSTSDAANDAFTKMIRRYGISSMTTYNDSETRSKGIGAQAMMFMKLPQSMQNAQAQEYQRRINALMTETGIRTFILGGEDNPIRAQLEAGEIDITNPQITSMVEKEKESLQRRMIAGEWIDFSDSGQVTNQKINKTPITSLFEQAGLSRAEQIAQLRARMQSKGFTEDYSDDDIAGIWGLGGVRNGAIVDFTRPDAELVAINRSPNGFGQFVYGRNYANQARSIYEAFGITPQGVYVSEEDMFRLGDADYDGDGAKTVYGDLAIAMRDTAVLHEQLRGSVKNVSQARERTLDYGDQIQGFSDTAVQRRLAVESSLAAAAAMGLTSGAGEKAAQFDLSNERNRRMLAAAIQAERAYSIATAGFKNASEVELTPEMLATNVLGRKWQFQPTKFSRVFNTTGQDGLDIPNAEDIFMATVDGKQIPVNMAELRKLNIDRTNLPSINQDSVVMGIRAASAMGPQGDSVLQMLAVEQALDQGIGYGNLGEASIRLLRNMRAMKLQTNAGLRGILTQEEAVLIEQQIAEARREINAQADSLAVGSSGKVRLADGTEMSRGAFVAAAARAANIDIAENHLHQFGITQAAVRDRFGDDATQVIEQMQPKRGIALPTKATEPGLIKRRPPSPEMPETTQPKDHGPAPDTNKESTPHARESATPAPMPSSSSPQALCPKCGASYNAALGSCPNCSNDSPIQPARSLREFLSRVQGDMTENGLPQDEATRLVTQWYNQNIPSKQDPIVMDDATSAKILEKYLRDGTIDSIYDYALETPAGDTPGVPRGKDILMSDLETFRQVEGSRAVYEDMMSAMRQTSSKWYGMAANQEENPEYGFYSKAMHQLKNTRLRFDNALQNGDASMFGADTALGTDLRNQLGLMEENYFAATRAHMSKSGDNAFEALRSSVASTGDEFDKQLAKLESWSKSVEKLEQQLLAFKKAREEMPADSDADTEADRKAIEAQETRIEEAKKLAAQGQVDLLKDNNESFAAKFESLSESMTGKTASPQEKIRRTVEQYKKQITKYQEQLDEAFAKNLLTKEDYNARKTQQAGLSTYASEGLERELQARNDAQEALQLARTQRQESSLRRRANQLARDPYGTRRNSLWGRATMERDGQIDQYDNLISSYEETIAQKKNKLMTMDPSSEGYANASAEVEKLEKELSEAQAAASKLEKTGSAMGFVFAEIGQRIGQVISQFGRQMFQQAIQEAKCFVIEFDTAMTEIQMITMKTDDEIVSLGDSLIQTAIDMKVSVSDVTSAAADLYRQGLDDDEVSVRMEDVLKFAKVTGMKTEDASKIITTALSNDLVSSSGEAMDALVAQGDSAATTATEIAKGMQKSAASAKQAGVSYEQLVTMLTIITSKTQLGGNQAGTALQTLMYRLYKVSEGDDYYDEDGNRVASNDATKALKQLGVSIYDDNGDQRGAYDIMVDIARNWNNADTISQEMVLNALGAGRQRSNIATLIQGLAEDDGALAEKYMSLASDSEGIADEKYLAYLGSLNAALTNVKTSFDQLINAFNLSGTSTSVLDFFAEFIQGLAKAEEASGALSATQTTVGIVLAGIMAYAHPIATIVTGVSALIATVVSDWGNQQNKVGYKENLSNTMNSLDREMSNIENIAAIIEETERLNDVQGRSAEQQQQLQDNLEYLSRALNVSVVAVGAASKGFENYGQTIAAARSELEGLTADELRRHAASAISQSRQVALDSQPDTEALTSLATRLAKYSMYGLPLGETANDAQYRTFDDFIKRTQASGEREASTFIESMAPLMINSSDPNPFGNMAALFAPGSHRQASDGFKHMQTFLYNEGYLSGSTFPIHFGSVEEQLTFADSLMAYSYYNDQLTSSDPFATAGMHGEFGAYDYSNALAAYVLPGQEQINLHDAWWVALSNVLSQNGIHKTEYIEGIHSEMPQRIGQIFDTIVLPMQGYLDLSNDTYAALKEAFVNDVMGQNFLAANRANQTQIIESTLARLLGEETYYRTDASSDTPVFDPGAYIDEHGSKWSIVSKNGYVMGFNDGNDGVLWATGLAKYEVERLITDMYGNYTFNYQTGVIADQHGEASSMRVVAINSADSEPSTDSLSYVEDAINGSINAYYEEDGIQKQLSADMLMEYVLSGRVLNADTGLWKNVETIEDVVRLFETTNYGNLTGTLLDMPVLGRILDSAQVEADNGDYVLDENNRQQVRKDINGNAMYMAFLSALAAETSGYSNLVSTSRLTDAAFALDAYSRIRRGGEITSDEADYLTAIVGEGLAGKFERASARRWDTVVEDKYLNAADENGNRTFILTTEKDGAVVPAELPQDVNNWLNTLPEGERSAATYAQYLEYANAENLELGLGALSGYEQKYVETLISNRLHGISGLTKRQAISGANEILTAINDGSQTNYLSNDSGMIDSYMSAYENMPAYVSMAQIVEETGHNIRDLERPNLSESDYRDISNALLQYGYSAEEALRVMKDLDQEIFVDGIVALNAYGDATAEITEYMQKWAGSTREVVSATRDLITTMAQASSNEYYRQQYVGGDRSVETLQAMEQMTGFSIEFLLNNSEIVAGLLPTFKASDLEGIQNMYSSLDIYLNDADLRTALGMDVHNFEAGYFNLATAASGLDSNNTTYRDFKAIVAQLALLNGGTLTVSQNEIPVAVSTDTTTGTSANEPRSESASDATSPSDGATEAEVPANGSTSAAQITTTTKTAYTINGPTNIPAVTKSTYDTALYAMLLTDNGFGAGNMTPANRIAIANSMFGIIQSGDIGNFTNKANLNTRSVYGSTFQNMPMVMALAEAISGTKDSRGNSLDLYDLQSLSPTDEGYQVLDTALRGVGSSAEHAQSVIEALDQEMAVAGIQANTAYGASAENVASIFSQLTGSIEQATSAYKEFRSLIAQSDQEAALFSMWIGGNRTLDVATQLANLYGVGVEELYADPSMATAEHNRYAAVNQEQRTAYINGYAEAALPGIINVAGIASVAAPTIEGWKRDAQNWAAEKMREVASTFDGDASTDKIDLPDGTSITRSDFNSPRTSAVYESLVDWYAGTHIGVAYEGSIADVLAKARTDDNYSGDLDKLELLSESAPEMHVTVYTDGSFSTLIGNLPEASVTQSALDQWVNSHARYAQQYGITGLTPLNQLRLAHLMRNKAESGTFADLYAASDPLTQQALMGSTANAGMYGYITLGLDKYNDLTGKELNIADLATMSETTEGYIEMKAAIEAMGLSFPEAKKYAQDFIQETENGILSLMKVFDDLTDEILEGSKAWSGTDRDRFGAAKEMAYAIDTAAENSWYRDIYLNATDKSQLPGYVLDYIANITDFDRTTIENDPSGIVTSMLQYSQLADKEGMTVQATELSQYLPVGGDLLNYLMPNAVANVLTPTPELIAGLSNISAPGAFEWQMLLGQVYSTGGTVKITPKTYEEEVVGDDGKPTGEKVTKTTYEITIDGVKRGLTEADADYAIDSEDVYGFGISKADAPGWKLDAADTLLGNIADKDLTDWMSGKSPDAIRALSSVIEGLPEQAHMAAIVEEGTGRHYSIFDLDTADARGRSEIEAALTAEGYSVDTARKAIADVNSSFYYEGIRAANAYGDATEDVINVMAQLSGSAEEAASAFQDLFSSMYKLSDMKTLQMLWNSGSRSDFVVSGIASMTGMSERNVRDVNNASLVSDRIAVEIGAAEEGYANQLSGWDQYLTPVLMNELGIGIGGSKTMSELIPRLTELATGGNENAQALLDLYSAASLDGGSLTVTGVEQLHMPSTKPSSIPLYMTDANGNLIPVTRRPITGASGQISYTSLNAAISEADQWYSDLTGSANGKAITSMTNLQKHRGAQRLWQEVSEGGFVDFYDGASDEIQKEIVGLTGTSGMYAYTAYGLEKAGFSANDLLTVKEGTDEYDRMKTAVSALGLTMHEAQEYVRDFAEESQDGILELNNVWGDFTTSVIENSQQWKGSIDSIVSAIKNMNTAASNAGSAQEARERYLNGDTSPDVYTAIANETGFSYDYVAQDPDGYVNRMMSTFERGNLAQVDNELNALGKAMVDEGNIPVLLSAILDKGGTLDLNFLSKLMSIMSGAQAQQMGAYFSYANHQGGQVAVSPYVDATTGKTYYQFTTTGLKAPKSVWDQQYIDYSTDSYGFGITNFTSLRKLGAAQQMMDIMRAGNLLEWQAGSRQSTIQGYSSVLGSMPQVMQLAAILEGNYKGDHSLMELEGLTKTDPAAYAEMDRVLRAAGYSAEFAIDAVSDLNSEMLYEGLRATNAYGDSTEQVIQLMQQMEDGAKGAAQAFTNLATAMAGVKDIQGMIWQYENSNLNPQLVADIASRTGLTETQVYNNRELTKQAQATLLASSQEELDAQVHSYDGLVNKLGLSSGNYTTDQIIAFAETGAGKGKWTETELAGFKLMAAVTSDHGYSPTYTVTEASASSAMPEIPAVNAQPVNTGIAWLDGLIAFGANLFGFGSNSSSTATPAPAQPRTIATGVLGSGAAATYSAADTWVNTQWNGAHQVGLTDLTDAQKIAGAQMIATWASEGTLTENLSAIQLDVTRSTLTGLTPTAAAFMDYGQTAESADLTYSDILGITEESENYQAWEDAYGSRDAFLEAQEAAKDFYEETSDGSVRVLKYWDDMTEEVLDGSKAWKGSARDVASAMKSLNSELTRVSNNQYFRQQYRAGNYESEVLDSIREQTGMTDATDEWLTEHQDIVEGMLDTAAESDLESVNAALASFSLGMQQEEMQVFLPTVQAAGGNIDFSAAMAQMGANASATMQSLAAMFAAFQLSVDLVEEDGLIYFKVNDIGGLGAGVKPSGGGGGGGGKSAVDKLLEEQEREQKLWEHRRKMIQYEETRYQNAGELSNYAIMLGHEADEIQRQIGLREKQIEQLKEQMRKTEEYSDDWYTLRNAIMSGEEALAELINDAEELDRTLEEVQQQILKLHTDLEGEVLQEIEARIQKERDMLDGTVQMQEIILEAIRERYRKEWELMQEDLNKKREALEEEIAMIDERLQRRKDAEDEAAKYEELAELQRQLALISMDSTRTKDQAELREKIAEIEDELSWDSAEDEAERQKEDLQDQADAYSNYETEYQEWLDEYLEDANNFAEEVNKVMAMNQEELLAWLSENVEAFSLSLDEAQKQMLQGWTDTFKQMHGIVDTYWEEIAKTLSSKENFLEYMMQSDTYVNASEDEQKQMAWNWGKMYDDWIAAKRVRDEAINWDHSDDFETGSSSPTGSGASTITYYGGKNSEGRWISGYGVTRGDAEVLARNKGLTGVIYSTSGPVDEPITSKVSASVPSRGISSSQFTPIALAYSNGGYVDYTGVALVHGSPSAPEAFLSADDTALVRSMLDAWQLVMARPTMSNIDGIVGKGQHNSIGDVHITITEASFAEDADYEEVARRVGAAFTKELSMQGFRTASFNF